MTTDPLARIIAALQAHGPAQAVHDGEWRAHSPLRPFALDLPANQRGPGWRRKAG